MNLALASGLVFASVVGGDQTRAKSTVNIELTVFWSPAISLKMNADAAPYPLHVIMLNKHLFANSL